MSLSIRLARAGAKKRPFYRIVLADTRAPRDGRFLERLGSYNPILPQGHTERVLLKEERIKYWLRIGAKPTDRVARFLGRAGLIPSPAIPSQPQ
ncbi:SSU ribosomal protein S16p [invertebrate metagenome]|uniref:SSU ribosomal protein S16p n=1 Tax=invertebrate metagenome TaxID=1711999 RepID=A0A484H6J1_9ZZZZ